MARKFQPLLDRTRSQAAEEHIGTHGPITLLPRIFFSLVLNHFALRLSRSPKSLRYSSVVSMCSTEQIVVLVNSACGPKTAGLPLPSNRGERDREMDSNPLRV